MVAGCPVLLYVKLVLPSASDPVPGKILYAATLLLAVPLHRSPRLLTRCVCVCLCVCVSVCVFSRLSAYRPPASTRWRWQYQWLWSHHLEQHRLLQEQEVE